MTGAEDHDSLKKVKFRYNNELNLGHIITAMSIVGALFLWESGTTSTIKINETKIGILSNDISNIKADVKSIESEIRKFLYACQGSPFKGNTLSNEVERESDGTKAAKNFRADTDTAIPWTR